MLVAYNLFTNHIEDLLMCSHNTTVTYTPRQVATIQEEKKKKSLNPCYGPGFKKCRLIFAICRSSALPNMTLPLLILCSPNAVNRQCHCPYDLLHSLEVLAKPCVVCKTPPSGLLNTTQAQAMDAVPAAICACTSCPSAKNSETKQPRAIGYHPAAFAETAHLALRGFMRCGSVQ